MGTTLLAAVFCDDKVIVAHVGDSRLYRLRGEELMAITRDHSLLQEQIDQGLMTPQEARYSLNRNLVTRAIGVDHDVEAEIHVYSVRPG
jgi:serine/threonine protein phosphatase PrpC